MELALLGLLILGLVMGEMVLRHVEPSLSGNIRHIHNMAPSLTELSSHDGIRIALIGNSLTNDGVDEGRLEAELHSTRVVKLVPDGTSLWDWKCLVRHHIINSSAPTADLVVLGFGWDQLGDNTRANPSRLGGYLCRWADLKRPGDIGLENFGDAAEFAAARVFHIYANRETLRNRVLDSLIPSYRMFTRKANRGGPLDPEAGPAETRYRQILDLATELEGKGVRLVVMAMPVRRPYALSPALPKMLESKGVILLDYRHLDGIDPRSFADEMHLNASGRKRLTEQLSTDLRTLVRG